MTKAEIKGNNEMIARFTGRSFSGGSITDYRPGTLSSYHFARIRYHTDWRLLMTAVDKINHLGFEMVIHSALNAHTCTFIYKKGDEPRHTTSPAPSKTLIEAVYSSAVAFINWYLCIGLSK